MPATQCTTPVPVIDTLQQRQSSPRQYEIDSRDLRKLAAKFGYDSYTHCSITERTSLYQPAEGERCALGMGVMI